MLSRAADALGKNNCTITRLQLCVFVLQREQMSSPTHHVNTHCVEQDFAMCAHFCIRNELRHATISLAGAHTLHKQLEPPPIVIHSRHRLCGLAIRVLMRLWARDLQQALKYQRRQQSLQHTQSRCLAQENSIMHSTKQIVQPPTPVPS